MPTFDDAPVVKSIDPQTGFDLSDLLFSFSRPISLCAMELEKTNDNKIIVGSKLKNVALLEEQSVNLQMDAMKDFKYSIKFDGIIVQAMVPFDEDKYLAVASIDQLKQYLPQNVDLDVNRDLMGVAFDAFVVNRGNKNGHIISTDVALAMVENFVNKPFNIEHNRKVVVGVCTGYGFSEFGSSKPLTLEEVKAMKDPFNVVLSGYVWKIVNPEFASELVESSDPSSNKYLSVSASWELGFNEFNVAKGNKNLADATIVEKEDEIVELKDRLKVFGGNGYTEDGEIVLLNLQGNVLPLGIGFTNTPAAEVSGVVISYDKPQTEEAVKGEEEKYVCADCGYKGADAEVCPKCGSENYEEIEEDDDEKENEVESSEIKMNKKSVPEENNNVKNIMQLKNIDDITDDSIKEVAASQVREFISNRIADLAKEWQSKVEEKETALKAAEDQIAELKTSLESIKADSEKVKEEFTKIQEDLKAKEIEANFQRRMALLDEEFDLTDEDRSIIAEDLNAIENDEQFEKWYKKFSTFAAAKKKSEKKFVPFKKEDEEKEDKKEKEEKASEVVASEEKTVEEVISSAEVKEEVLPNASSPQEVSLVEKIGAAFNKNSVKIK
jgi:predicted nucleic-acid-binding Zn-ribbon protein